VQATPGARLIVVGAPLPERPGGGLWSPRIVGLNHVDDAGLAWLYANCRALIAPAFEDFGLTPVEAATFGKPTLGLRAGGYLDTVMHGRTGLLVSSPTVTAFAAGIERLNRIRFDASDIMRHADRFSVQRFVAALRHQVDATLAVPPLAA
jgi:glycosyltransferase involved in cell wall biosynthesis